MRFRIYCVLLVAAFAVRCAGQSPRSFLLVLNKGDNALAIIDPESLDVVARIPTGEGPHEVAVSPDGRTALVSNYGGRVAGNSLSVIDIVHRKEIKRIDLQYLRRPHGIAYADGNFYFTIEVNKAVARYAVSAGQVDWLVGTGQDFTHMVVYDPKTNRLFTTNVGSDSVCIIDLTVRPPGPRMSTVKVGRAPEGMDLSPDGKELWVANSRDGHVSVVDTAAGKVIDNVDVGSKLSNRLKFTPNGDFALISDVEGSQVVVVEARTRKTVARVAVEGNPEGILIQPDGTRAFVALGDQDKIVVLDLKDFRVLRAVNPGKGPDGMAWATAH